MALSSSEASSLTALHSVLASGAGFKNVPDPVIRALRTLAGSMTQWLAVSARNADVAALGTRLKELQEHIAASDSMVADIEASCGRHGADGEQLRNEQARLSRELAAAVRHTQELEEQAHQLRRDATAATSASQAADSELLERIHALQPAIESLEQEQAQHHAATTEARAVTAALSHDLQAVKEELGAIAIVARTQVNPAVTQAVREVRAEFARAQRARDRDVDAALSELAATLNKKAWRKELQAGMAGKADRNDMETVRHVLAKTAGARAGGASSGAGAAAGAGTGPGTLAATAQDLHAVQAELRAMERASGSAARMARDAAKRHDQAVAAVAAELSELRTNLSRRIQEVERSARASHGDSVRAAADAAVEAAMERHQRDVPPTAAMPWCRPSTPAQPPIIQWTWRSGTLSSAGMIVWDAQQSDNPAQRGGSWEMRWPHPGEHWVEVVAYAWPPPTITLFVNGTPAVTAHAAPAQSGAVLHARSDACRVAVQLAHSVYVPASATASILYDGQDRAGYARCTVYRLS